MSQVMGKGGEWDTSGLVGRQSFGQRAQHVQRPWGMLQSQLQKFCALEAQNQTQEISYDSLGETLGRCP